MKLGRVEGGALPRTPQRRSLSAAPGALLVLVRGDTLVELVAMALEVVERLVVVAAVLAVPVLVLAVAAAVGAGRLAVVAVGVAAVTVAAAHHEKHHERAGEDEEEQQDGAHRCSFRLVMSVLVMSVLVASEDLVKSTRR